MTVKEFIKILKKANDIDIATITFYVDEKSYDIKNISQFGLLTDVNIHLKEIEIPVLQPATIQRNKKKMIDKTIKKIKKN